MTTPIRWIAIALHAIVLSFGIVVILFLTDGNLIFALNEATHDSAMKEISYLSLLVIGGNFIGVVFLLSPLFNNVFGFYILMAYELLLAIATFFFLSLDYSLVSCMIVAGLLYVAYERKKLKWSASK